MAEESKLDQRISRLEATVEGIATNLQSLAHTVQTIASQNRTNWGVIISAGSLLVGIITVMGWLGVAKPQEVQSKVLNDKILFQKELFETKLDVVDREIKLSRSESEKWDEAVWSEIESMKKRAGETRQELEEKTKDRFTKQEYYELENRECR